MDVRSSSTRYRVSRTPGRYAVLLNARAKGWNGTIHQAIQRYVSAQDLFLTDDFRQARRIVERLLTADYSTIFTAGGDGTIMYLVNEMEARIRAGQVTREDAPPIGVLRLGTGNALATYLGSDDILPDLRALRSGAPLTVHSVNMLEAADGSLFPFAGIGWDADILGDYDLVKDMVRGTMLEPHIAGLGGYGAAIASRTIPRALTQKPINLRITTLDDNARRINYEGQTLTEYAAGDVLYEGPVRICGASSIPYWGFQVRMFPRADLDPERFQLRCYHGTVAHVVAHMRDFWRGRIAEQHMEDFLASHVRLEIQGDPVPYQISGDAAGVERVIEWKLAKEPVSLAVPLH